MATMPRLSSCAPGSNDAVHASNSGPAEQEHRAGREAADGGGVIASAEQRDLPQDVAGTEARELELALARQLPAHLRLAGDQHGEALARVPLAPQQLAAIRARRT